VAGERQAGEYRSSWNCFFNLSEPCVLYIGRAYRYPPDVAFYIFLTCICLRSRLLTWICLTPGYCIPRSRTL
jgi:hypothetical protein